MKPEIIYDVVMKIIGPINPIGETNEDDRRLENLRTFIDLTNRFLANIDDIAGTYKNAREFSKKRAADVCAAFYNDLGIVE